MKAIYLKEPPKSSLDDDPLATAKGILLGVLFSSCIWIAILWVTL